MKSVFKLTSWLILIFGWAVVVVGAFLNDRLEAGIGLGVAAIICWVTWWVILKYVYGVRRHLQRHLQLPLPQAASLSKSVHIHRVADFRRALEFLYADKGETTQRRYGLQVPSLPELSNLDKEIEPLRYVTTETREGQFEILPSNAVYALYQDRRPFVACLAQQANDYDYGSYSSENSNALQILAPTLDDARRAIEYVQHIASIQSVYRGMMLHIARESPHNPTPQIRVADRPRIDDERIVLPPEVLEVLDRTISARLAYHRLLQRHGHTSKTGVLLHGPPGTGKTLVAKRLIGGCQNHTAIVPATLDDTTIREAFRLAAYLQPALVVIEDVDLLAERRETNANVTGLQTLMNELDGLENSAEAIVLMTTNRPEILEPALAARPGRVSQAIHFPLPDAHLRERLLHVFCAKAETSQVDFPRWIQRTEGASPAFLEELVKRAILLSAERLSGTQDEASVQLRDEDFDRAMHELVVFGGELTGQLLGFPGKQETRA